MCNLHADFVVDESWDIREFLEECRQDELLAERLMAQESTVIGKLKSYRDRVVLWWKRDVLKLPQYQQDYDPFADE